jgi:hypothetical protein
VGRERAGVLGGDIVVRPWASAMQLVNRVNRPKIGFSVILPGNRRTDEWSDY